MPEISIEEKVAKIDLDIDYLRNRIDKHEQSHHTVCDHCQGVTGNEVDAALSAQGDGYKSPTTNSDEISSKLVDKCPCACHIHIGHITDSLRWQHCDKCKPTPPTKHRHKINKDRLVTMIGNNYKLHQCDCGAITVNKRWYVPEGREG